MIRWRPLAAFVAGLRAVPRPRRAGGAGSRLDPPRQHRRHQAEEIEVVGSIAPTAGPTIGSGIPARISTVTGEEIEAWEPRLLADALATQPGISLYDDLGSAYKLNLSTRGFNVGPVVGLPPGRIGVPRWGAAERARRGRRSTSTCCRWSTCAGSSC